MVKSQQFLVVKTNGLKKAKRLHHKLCVIVNWVLDLKNCKGHY